MSASRFDSIKRPHLFAHRGGNAAGEHKENSKRAFNSAVRLGYQFLETDVILTKDKQVICCHGSHNWYTKRRSGLELRKKLQKLTYKQIKEKYYLDGVEMPRLEDILTSFPKALFSIDVKTKEVIIPLVDLLRNLKAEDRVIVTSFSLLRTLKTNKLLRGRKIKASLCLSRFSAKAVSPINSIFIRFVRVLGVRYLQVSYSRITKRLINIAHKNGIYIYAWTVNDQESMRRILDLGVDGIMSDESKLLLQTVKNKKA